MARAIAADHLQAFRFKVAASAGAMASAPFVGSFQTCTAPEITLENVEFKDNSMSYKRKFPGIPTVNDISLTKGVIQSDTELYDWIVAAKDGSEYRIDITISHTDKEGNDRYQYVLENAFPVRVKVDGDFDSNSSEVTLSEIDIAYESFTVITV